jgi:hypothetical protein
LKTKVLDPQAVDETSVKTILQNGAIDYHDNDGIYVTSYPFNFWLDIDKKRKLIVMYTYWETVFEAGEIDIIRFVNNANAQKIMLQFSYNERLGRLYGHYAHPYNVGLIPPHVLKLCQKFSSVFEEVVHEGIAEGLLEELPGYPSDDAVEASAEAASGSTVH